MWHPMSSWVVWGLLLDERLVLGTRFGTYFSLGTVAGIPFKIFQVPAIWWPSKFSERRKHVFCHRRQSTESINPTELIGVWLRSINHNSWFDKSLLPVNPVIIAFHSFPNLDCQGVQSRSTLNDSRQIPFQSDIFFFLPGRKLVPWKLGSLKGILFAFMWSFLWCASPDATAVLLMRSAISSSWHLTGDC